MSVAECGFLLAATPSSLKGEKTCGRRAVVMQIELIRIREVSAQYHAAEKARRSRPSNCVR